MVSDSPPKHASVKRLSQVDTAELSAILHRYGIELCIGDYPVIPGSYWGEDEAGLLGTQLMARPDTPLHSVLHEACHFICMTPQRRENLHTDAGGDTDEENAVCYLQILLADHVSDAGRDSMWRDMDTWGYTFRLGSARAWFEDDAEEVLVWLKLHDLVDESQEPTWQIRL